eukprot:9517442-Karenia_brevis.AAC.1
MYVHSHQDEWRGQDKNEQSVVHNKAYAKMGPLKLAESVAELKRKQQPIGGNTLMLNELGTT